MNTEPASVLHRFVSLANGPDYLALGWMRERPLGPGVEKHLRCRHRHLDGLFGQALGLPIEELSRSSSCAALLEGGRPGYPKRLS
jgi:hypothetical protein